MRYIKAPGPAACHSSDLRKRERSGPMQLPVAILLAGLSAEAALLTLRSLGVVRFSWWWLTTPLWLGGAIITMEAAALASFVAVARQLIRWALP